MVVELLVGALILLLGWVGIILYFRWRGRAAQTRRLLQRSARVPVATLQDGVPSKITGRLVYATEPLRAPLTGRPCAVWEVEVEEFSADRESLAPVWQPFIIEQDAQDFYVDDGRDRVLVRAGAVRVTAVKDAEHWSGVLRNAPPPLERYLEKHGEQSKGKLGFNRSLRYREGVLEAGEIVTVLGTPRLETAADGPASYRGRESQLVITGLGDGFVVVSDDPATRA